MTNEPPSSINKQWKQIGGEANLTAHKILQSTYGLFQITTQKPSIDSGEGFAFVRQTDASLQPQESGSGIHQAFQNHS